MKIIDFHTHLQDSWFARALPSEDAFISAMDRCGVETSCIFTLMGFYRDCPKENDALAAYAQRHPTRLVAFATVDPKLGSAAVEELDRCLSNPHFRGVKFHNWLQATAPSMVRETTIQLLRCAAKHRVPTLFHDGTPPYASTFQIAALARWVPEATVVLGHAGLADYVFVAGQLLRDIPNLYACYCGPKAGDLPYLLRMAGPERVLFGSDFGFSHWHMLAERIDDVRESGISAMELENVFDNNARKLLRLPS
jgi:hypothetical protein